MATKKKPAPAEGETAEMEPGTRFVQVEVTRTGYMEKLRREGDVFAIKLAEGESLPSWVTEVE